MWSEKTFNVSHSAETLISTYISNPSQATGTTMPYPSVKDKPVRTMQVDLIAYDKIKKSLTSFEIKRGNGMHDSKAKASMLKNLLTQQTLLKSYGKSKGYKSIKDVDSKVIFYYGKCSLDPEYSLTSDDLDEYFGFEVVGFVEEVTSLFREKIEHTILELVDPETNAFKGQILKILETSMKDNTDKEDAENKPWFQNIFGRKS